MVSLALAPVGRKVAFIYPITPALPLTWFAFRIVFVEDRVISPLRHVYVFDGSLLSKVSKKIGLKLNVQFQAVHLALKWLEVFGPQLSKKVGLLMHERLQPVHLVLKLLIVLVHRLRLLWLLLLLYPRCVDGVRITDMQRLLSRSAIQKCELVVVLVHLSVAVVDVRLEMAFIDVALHWSSGRMMPSHTILSS